MLRAAAAAIVGVSEHDRAANESFFSDLSAMLLSAGSRLVAEACDVRGPELAAWANGPLEDLINTG